MRYELQVAYQKTKASHQFVIPGNQSRIQIFLDKVKDDLAPDCVNESSLTNLFDFRIRSVTYNSDEQEFPSKWSSIESVPAYCESKSYLLNDFLKSMIRKF